LFEE